MTPKFKGNIKDGKLTINNRDSFNIYLKQLDGDVNVIVQKYRKPRSLNQNNFYWLYLGLIQEETGNDSYEMHEYFKRIFLKPKQINIFNKQILIPESTTNLDKKEFTDYLNKIENLTGIPIPDPNQVYG